MLDFTSNLSIALSLAHGGFAPFGIPRGAGVGFCTRDIAKVMLRSVFERLASKIGNFHIEYGKVGLLLAKQGLIGPYYPNERPN